jgi:hypothetical protein
VKNWFQILLLSNATCTATRRWRRRSEPSGWRWGLYNLDQVDPELEPTRFQSLRLSSENLISKFAVRFSTCTATRRGSAGESRTRSSTESWACASRGASCKGGSLNPSSTRHSTSRRDKKIDGVYRNGMCLAVKSSLQFQYTSIHTRGYTGASLHPSHKHKPTPLPLSISSSSPRVSPSPSTRHRTHRTSIFWLAFLSTAPPHRTFGFSFLYRPAVVGVMPLPLPPPPSSRASSL